MKKRPLICVVTADCTRQFIRDTISGIIRQSQLCGCDVAILAPLTHFCFTLKPTHREMEREMYKLILSDDFDDFKTIVDHLIEVHSYKLHRIYL